MPLINSKSNKAIGKNIGREQDAGKPHDQAVAIAMEAQRRAKAKKMAKGGMINEKMDPEHEPQDPHAKHLMEQVMEHPEAEHIARAIMQKKMAMGGCYSEGGEVDDSLENDDLALHNEGDHDEGEEGPMLAEGGEIEEDNPIMKKKRMLSGIMSQIRHKNGV